jgi:DHA1 family multidrug/chloramphenicol efflux transport protein-like MFS transporter
MAKPLIKVSFKQAITFACFLVLYEFLTYIANDMIMPGMLQVVASFNAPESAVATSLTAYVLGGASLQLILGPVSDAFGRRPMMLLGACLFFMFTLLITGAHSIDQFFIARFFQGMGLCFIGVIGYATIQEIFAEMDAIRIIAIMANAAILAPLLGPLLGAVVIHYYSWRLIFFVIAGLALVALWGLWRYMPEPIGQETTEGKKIPKAHLAWGTVFSNYKALMSNPAFCASAFGLAVLVIPCMSWIALSPVIMIAQSKLSVIAYGIWQLPIFGATILGNWVLHKLTRRHELKAIVYLGCCLFSASMILLVLLPWIFGPEGYGCLLPGIILYFFSLSIISAPLNRYCLFVTSVGKGTASAVVSMSGMLVGALGIEVVNFFYAHNNLNFALCLFALGLVFLVLVALAFKKGKTP